MVARTIAGLFILGAYFSPPNADAQIGAVTNDKPMSFWGLSNGDLCLKRRNYVISKAIDHRGKATVDELADAGDSVALYLRGMSRVTALSKKYRFTFEKEQYIEDLRLSAEAGNPMGMASYAKAIASYKQDSDFHIKANDLFLRSVSSGCAEAQYHYANFLAYTKPKNVPLAREYFTMSADSGYMGAQSKLAYAYSQGNLGFTVSKTKALKYFELSAEQGDINSQVYAADMHQNGIGAPANADKAIYYYSLAAEKNDTRALLALGDIYSEGVVTPKNLVKARNYYNLTVAEDRGYHSKEAAKRLNALNASVIGSTSSPKTSETSTKNEEKDCIVSEVVASYGPSIVVDGNWDSHAVGGTGKTTFYLNRCNTSQSFKFSKGRAFHSVGGGSFGEGEVTLKPNETAFIACTDSYGKNVFGGRVLAQTRCRQTRKPE